MMLRVSLLFALLGFTDGFLQPTSISSTKASSFARSGIDGRIVGFPARQETGGSLWMSATICSNEELLPGIEAIDKANLGFYEKLSDLRENAYFKLYSVDILASCEYMPQELFECYSETCEIYPVDEDEIPQKIRATDASESDFELDGWARWDMPTEDYYDISAFPEGYTGYDGKEVWNFIHNKICFQGYQYDDDHWKADFNKAVSGLHSMISAQITRGIQERVDSGESFSDDEKWRDPNVEFERRLSPRGDTPLALENLYFSYMILLKAASVAKSRLLKDCESGLIDPGAATVLKAILDDPILEDPSVSIASQKLLRHVSAGNLWEARMRTRELVRIMNCVQCNKCRLHGKISCMGLSTALQILVGREGEGADVNQIHRVELATMMATLHKFATAVNFCQQKLS